ncbi:MAG TPA: twin-arginine translocation signal domain-containing protein [Acidobacteriaceae bacterium]|nr:twin-arginine translocation signal domain-containing protein [Acidobacteriaceae bacterium]
MLKRRDFLKAAGVTTAAAFVFRHPLAAEVAGVGDAGLHFVSKSMEAELSAVAPEFLSLNVDGLGKGRRGPNIVEGKSSGSGFKAVSRTVGGTRRVEYRPEGAGENSAAAWTFEFTDRKMVLTSEWSGDAAPTPVAFHFHLERVHSTVLGLFREDNLLAAPALMHFPGQGSMRLTASVADAGLPYTSVYHKGVATFELPAATAEQKRVVYTLEVTAVHPETPGIAGDARFDAFRRNWLNELQLNPTYPALANNTASDTCAFCYYAFSDIAALTPPLVDGLTALDVMRQTLDRILAGGAAYGMPREGAFPSATSDTVPSLLIAAANCVRGGERDAWLTANYGRFRRWTENMLATITDTTSTNGDGLVKFSISGNSGIWPDGPPRFRPSNWWDTIGFGHEDAYGNALAYRALRDMAMMAQRMGEAEDAARYEAAAEKIRGIFYKRFYDPATGVLGGWRSSDGELHDYYFLWVNGIAIHYGLVEKAEANAIMDKLLAKMKEVGYDKFEMGLPGNLITVPLKDYVDKTGKGRYGGGVQPDNSDGFQNYENGGATGAYAYFTLAALYDLGRKEEADRIFFPMLKGYGACGFEGRGANGMSNDWRRWDGTPMGYEGYLTDDYYAMMAVPLRQEETRWESGFRPATMLT